MKNHHKELFGFAGSVGRTERAVPLIVLALLLGSGERAAGFPVTFEFAGEVASFMDEPGLLEDSVEVGTPFSGSFTFESTTPDGRPANETLGWYEDSIISISGEVGGIPFGSDFPSGSLITIENDTTTVAGTSRDAFTLRSSVTMSLEQLFLFVRLGDPSGAMFDSDGLPSDPPALDLLDVRFLGIESQRLGVGFTGPLNTLVPEPGTLALLGAGLLGLARRSRRRLPSGRGIHRTMELALLGLLTEIGIPAVVSAQQPNCGCMDVVFVVDVTNSMEGAIASMRTELPSVIDNVAIPASGGDLRLGLITFNDPGVMAPPDSIRVWSALTSDVNSVLEELDDLAFTDGAGRPEISDEALREMLLAAGIGSGTTCAAVSETRFDVPFRSHCVKHAILITDDLPGGCDDEFDASDVTNAVARAVEAARDSGIHFSGFFPANRSPSVL